MQFYSDTAAVSSGCLQIYAGMCCGSLIEPVVWRRCLTQMGTSKDSFVDLTERIARNTGGVSVSPFTSDVKACPRLRCHAAAMCTYLIACMLLRCRPQHHSRCALTMSTNMHSSA